jgi:enoyl-CoA hydratase
VTIDRPARRNAVDRPTADALVEAFRSFDADGTLAFGLANRVVPDGSACASDP